MGQLWQEAWRRMACADDDPLRQSPCCHGVALYTYHMSNKTRRICSHGSFSLIFHLFSFIWAYQPESGKLNDWAMREAYLLLREREKAGVEPISKVWTLFCDENFIWHEVSCRILSTPRSFWLTCPPTRSWGKPGWWSTSKWWSSPTWRETSRGSTLRKLIVQLYTAGY